MINQSTYSNSGQGMPEPVEPINIKALFFKYLRFWPLFMTSLIVSFVAAYFSNRYATPVYSIYSTMLLKDAKAGSASNDFLQGIQSFKSSQNLQNEIAIMGSRSMAEITLKQLNFGVSYYSDGNVKTSEIFGRIPVTVEFDTAHSQLWGTLFEIDIVNERQYQIFQEKKPSGIAGFLGSSHANIAGFKAGVYSFGEYLEGDAYRFKIDKTNYYTGQKEVIQFRLNTQDGLISAYAGRVRVAPINKSASIVTLSLDSPVPNKDIIYLNKFSETYIKTGLEEKNLIARNTIGFINEQLNGVSDSLDSVEDRLQQFRIANKSIDLTSSGNQVFAKLTGLEGQMEIQKLKLKYYNYLLTYIAQNRNFKDVVAPSILEIEDQVTTTLINKLIDLYAQRNATSYSATELNPYLPQIDSQIEALTNTLEENIKNAINAVKIETDDIGSRIRRAEGNLSQLPRTERNLVSIKRRYSLNENLYVYLLQKRAEAGIAKASNLADSKVIDAARVVALIYPNTSSNYFYALIIGLLIPFAFVFGKEYLNDTITSRAELEKLTKIPVLGVVAHSNKPTNLVVADNPKSVVSETFRSLRSNLQYLASDKEQKSILITSGISGEGKTFCAINLASVLAQGSKKTLLLGVDLRKPRIFDDFGLTNDIGLSTYLIGKANKKNIIQKTRIQFLDVITSGPLAPNPSELLMTKRFDELINELKTEYDNIVFDSPPLGLVADSFELLKYADITLYVVRQNYTTRNILSTINNLYAKGTIKNVSMILNDFSAQSSYGYGYGYGYGYYEEDEKRLSIWKKLLPIRRAKNRKS